MNGESDFICCERVARATSSTLTLSGAPSPFCEFKDMMAVGGVCLYELRFVTRSMTSILAEIGVGVYSTGNVLTRIAIIRSVRKRHAIRFARGDSQHGVYFVRASRNDLLDSLSASNGRNRF